jgi:flavin-dependent dehydrogenase
LERARLVSTTPASPSVSAVTAFRFTISESAVLAAASLSPPHSAPLVNRPSGVASMSNPIFKQAIVIGAGMGGLAAAKALAPHFEKVFVLDRDALPDGPVARMGTPQARHAHVLLAGGQKALEALFPGIECDFAAAGAVTVRSGRDIIVERPGYDPFPQRDLGFDVFCLSRPLLESVCRRRLREAPNVELRSRSRVRELVPSPDHFGIAAVRFEHGEGEPQTLAADLVVDASGRGAPTLSFLEKHRLAKAGPKRNRHQHRIRHCRLRDSG